MQHLGAGGRHLEHLLVGDARQPAGRRDDPRVGGEDAVDVGVDLAHVGASAAASATAVVSEPPRPSVVISLVSCGDALEAGDDDDRARRRAPADAAGRDIDDAGLAVAESVITPAWLPV